MTSYFCPHCGIKTDGNISTINGIDNQYYLICPVCNFAIEFRIQVRTSKTNEEIETAFQQTELTDYQRTGRANKGKWARKRK